MPDQLDFDWDSGNINKNYVKHQIDSHTSEEPFFDPNLLTFPDPLHSKKEARSHLIGQTKSHQLLFISYTIRKKQIRIISARLANKEERSIYEKQKTKSNP